jgi:hypothetical protein
MKSPILVSDSAADFVLAVGMRRQRPKAMNVPEGTQRELGALVSQRNFRRSQWLPTHLPATVTATVDQKEDGKKFKGVRKEH